MSAPQVAVVMGSLSDYEVMAAGVRVLREYGIPCECRVLSAHRDPEGVADFARAAESRGLRLLIAGAGGAAHLAGALAAHTSLPVIGVPLASSPLAGMDALLATVQMPAGVPVATVGIGEAGAANAAHLAARILGLGDPRVADAVARSRRDQARRVQEQDGQVGQRLGDDGLR